MTAALTTRVPDLEEATEHLNRAHAQLALARVALKRAEKAGKRGDLLAVVSHVAQADGHKDNAQIAFADARRAMGKE